MTVYPEGRHELGPEQFAGEVFGFEAYFDPLLHIDPKITVTVELWVSRDTGTTWEFGGSATRQGGPARGPLGPVTKAGFRSHYNLSKEINGKWFSNIAAFNSPLTKVVLTVDGGQLETIVQAVKAAPRTAASAEVHRSIAVVQSVSVFGSLVNTITTAGITTTAGNLLIANLPYLIQGTSAFSTFTDNKSNTWSESVAELGAGTVTRLRQRYVEDCLGGASHTFTLTVTAGGNNYIDIIVNEVSGYAASPLDQTKTDTDTTGTSHTTGATATTAQANELLIACGCGGTAFTETYTGEGGWTTEANQANVSATTQGAICQSRVATDGPTTYVWTWSSSANMAAKHYITTWKETSSGVVVGSGLTTGLKLQRLRLAA